MQKKEFVYRKRIFILVWMLAIGAPFIWYVPKWLEHINGMKYYIFNVLIMIVVVFFLWGMTNILPGIKRKGYYRKEDGNTVIEYDGKRILLDSVTELMLTDKHASSKGINLFIRNNGRKIEFLSEVLGKKTKIEDTIFYKIFSQVLAENPHLKQEKDIWEEPIDYWYKLR